MKEDTPNTELDLMAEQLAYEKEALDNIEKYGCHVVCVMGNEDEPSFAYSVGIYKTSGAPELIVIGLKPQLAGSNVNQYHRRVKDGEVFTPGKLYSGFLKKFEVMFEPVDKSCPAYANVGYFALDRRLYGEDDFEALQMVFPDTSGVWPWEAAATDWFKACQPLLSGRGTVH